MPKSTMSFVEGFFTSRGVDIPKDEYRIFDWIKAAQIIKEKQPKVASAGLEDDWNHTSGKIYENNQPVPKNETYTYLASSWAIPTLCLNEGDNDDSEEEIPCWVYTKESKWNEKTYWPKEALDILNDQSN